MVDTIQASLDIHYVYRGNRCIIDSACKVRNYNNGRFQMKYLIVIPIIVFFCIGFYLGYKYNKSEIINPDTTTEYVPDDPSPCLYNAITIQLQRNRELITVTATDGCKRSTAQYNRDIPRHRVSVGVGYSFTGTAYMAGYSYNIVDHFDIGTQAIISRDYGALFITASYSF